MRLFIIALLLAGMALSGCASQEAVECDDSDGGMNGNVLGKVTAASGGRQQVFEDSCANDSTVREYYCDGRNVSEVDIECGGEYICQNASCVRQQCTDSSMGYYDKGVTRKGRLAFTDTCTGPATGTEYYCDVDGDIVNEPFTCEPGFACADGACQKANCTDSDGMDQYVKGNASDGAAAYVDECSDNTHVKEYYCDGSAVAYGPVECRYGCRDGRCLKSASTCSDTDGGNDIYNGGILLIKTGLVEGEYLDKCVDGDTVKEYYCTDDWYAEAVTDCPKGLRCVQASCREDLCVDSDDGFSLYRKGTVTKGGESRTDTCRDARGGTEYVCSGNNITAMDFTCPMGYSCNNGVCG